MAYEGHDAMYTGEPSKPAKIHRQTAYGLVDGDGVGYEDNGDRQNAGQIKKGLTVGGQRSMEEESTKTVSKIRKK